MINEDITDVMYHIGEYLVSKTIYISRNDIKNKAQFENEYRNSNTDCIHLFTKTFTYKMDSFFYPEYRYLSEIISEIYSRRARQFTSGFLLSSNEFAQLCFANKNDSVTKCIYGNDRGEFVIRLQN